MLPKKPTGLQVTQVHGASLTCRKGGFCCSRLHLREVLPGSGHSHAAVTVGRARAQKEPSVLNAWCCVAAAAQPPARDARAKLQVEWELQEAGSALLSAGRARGMGRGLKS